MKRVLIGLAAAWMLAATVPAQTEAAPRPADALPIQIQFTYLGAFDDDGARLGDEVFAAPSLMRKWGWEVSTRFNDADVQIDSRVVRAKMIMFKGRPMVSVNEAARLAGAKTSWSQDQKVFFIRSWVRNIELTTEGIRVDGTLPFRPRAFRVGGPDRFVIDLEGAEYEAGQLGPLPAGWRAGQLNDNTVRVVIEHPSMAKQGVPAKLEAGRTFEIPLLSVNEAAASSLVVRPSAPAPAPATLPPSAQPAILSGFEIGSANQDSESFALPVKSGRPGAAVGLYRTVRTLVLNIPNSRLESPVQPVVSSRLVQSVSVTQTSASVVTVVFQLNRAAAFEFKPSQSAFGISLFVPRFTQGGIAGKTVVVDPGHGGRDPGAMMKGAREKDIVLSVSRLLAEELKGLGASVILTRTTDDFVALQERPAIANRNNAAVFVSIHVNSNTVANTASGTKMFFHRRNSEGMLLAQCLDEEFEAIGRIPSRGTWSDTRIYRSGFAVLRNSDMPAVLVETGFINHDRDRAALVTAAHQRDMAKAIARALLVYFGQEQPR